MLFRAGGPVCDSYTVGTYSRNDRWTGFQIILSVYTAYKILYPHCIDSFVEIFCKIINSMKQLVYNGTRPVGLLLNQRINLSGHILRSTVGQSVVDSWSWIIFTLDEKTWIFLHVKM